MPILQRAHFSLFWALAIGFFSSAFFMSAHAADTVLPRENIMLEIGATGTILDTSSFQRPVQATGAISASTDSSIWSFIDFGGTGVVASSLGWNVEWSTPFSIAFWVKAPEVFRDNPVNFINECPKYWLGYKYRNPGDDIFSEYLLGIITYGYYTYLRSPILSNACYKVYNFYEEYWSRTNNINFPNPDDVLPQETKQFAYNWTARAYVTYSVSWTWKIDQPRHADQTLFSFQKSSTWAMSISDFWVRISRDYACKLEGSNKIFDCKILKDWNWHSVVFRRTTGFLELFIDWKFITKMSMDVLSTSRTLFVGKSFTFDREQTDFYGSIARFTVLNTDITDEDIYRFSNNWPIQKNLAEPIITINQPNSLQEKSKTISAQTSTGELFFSITKTSVCNDTLSFEPYISLVFSSTNDNWSMICYKAINESKIVFKLSNPVYGVSWTAQDSSFDDLTGWFGNYLTWPHADKSRIGDFSVVFLSKIYWTNFIDINWDGLVDILYNSRSTPQSAYLPIFLGIFINTGDYNFKPVYRCNIPMEKSYYGDCVAPISK